MENKKSETMRKRIIKKEICRYNRKIICTCLFLILLVLVKFFVADIVIVQGRSMEPALYEGQILILNKSAYWFAEPQKDHIVVVQYGNEEIIKRIAGCPGDIPMGTTTVLPEGRYYILGDNEDMSMDSRSFGSISEDAIIGKVIK